MSCQGNATGFVNINNVDYCQVRCPNNWNPGSDYVCSNPSNQPVSKAACDELRLGYNSTTQQCLSILPPFYAIPVIPRTTTQAYHWSGGYSSEQYWYGYWLPTQQYEVAGPEPYDPNGIFSSLKLLGCDLRLANPVCSVNRECPRGNGRAIYTQATLWPHPIIPCNADSSCNEQEKEFGFRIAPGDPVPSDYTQGTYAGGTQVGGQQALYWRTARLYDKDAALADQYCGNTPNAQNNYADVWSQADAHWCSQIGNRSLIDRPEQIIYPTNLRPTQGGACVPNQGDPRWLPGFRNAGNLCITQPNQQTYMPYGTFDCGFKAEVMTGTQLSRGDEALKDVALRGCGQDVQLVRSWDQRCFANDFQAGVAATVCLAERFGSACAPDSKGNSVPHCLGFQAADNDIRTYCNAFFGVSALQGGGARYATIVDTAKNLYCAQPENLNSEACQCINIYAGSTPVKPPIDVANCPAQWYVPCNDLTHVMTTATISNQTCGAAVICQNIITLEADYQTLINTTISASCGSLDEILNWLRAHEFYLAIAFLVLFFIILFFALRPKTSAPSTKK